MSQRAKRPNRLENDGGPGGTISIGASNNGGVGPPPIKRRKGRPPLNPSNQNITTIAEDEDSVNAHGNSTTATWQPRLKEDPKMSSIYNRSAPEAPAELFR